jgi:signal transduction histidine kinase
MVAEVARSRQAQRDFLASAAHELKTPVTLVAGFARALSDGTARREGAEDDAVEYIQTESAHLVHVVDELFALAKLDADAGALVPAPCRVEALLHATARRFAGASLSRGVAIEVDCGSHIPLCVWDEEQVTSALSNLLGNALEHAGSDTIAVRACVSEGGVTIEVEDWGRGIPPGDLPHIFDRFYRGQSRRGDGHAGLGLALVREIAERHGGSVSVRSGVAEGTCFALTLPLVPPTAADSRVTGSEMTA